MVEAIRIGEPALEVRLRRSARARRMVLRVARGGTGPTLTLPPHVPLAAARAFVVDHEGWLRRHLAAAPAGIPVAAGAVLPFGDGEIAVQALGRGRTHVRDGILFVPGGAAREAAAVAAFLREAARRDCAAGVERHAARLGLAPGRISLRDPRSRWGSCSSSGDLMFSWRLAMAPREVLDYVVAHEVAHLAEMNHSPRFWAVVERLFPDHARPRAWLRRNGSRLHVYDFASPAAA